MTQSEPIQSSLDPLIQEFKAAMEAAKTNEVFRSCAFNNMPTSDLILHITGTNHQPHQIIYANRRILIKNAYFKELIEAAEMSETRKVMAIDESGIADPTLERTVEATEETEEIPTESTAEAQEEVLEPFAFLKTKSTTSFPARNSSQNTPDRHFLDTTKAHGRPAGSNTPGSSSSVINAGNPKDQSAPSGETTEAQLTPSFVKQSALPEDPSLMQQSPLDKIESRESYQFLSPIGASVISETQSQNRKFSESHTAPEHPGGVLVLTVPAPHPSISSFCIEFLYLTSEAPSEIARIDDRSSDAYIASVIASYFPPVLENSTFLKLEPLLTICFNRFPDIWSEVIEQPAFPTLSIQTLELLLERTSGHLDAYPTLQILLAWSASRNPQSPEFPRVVSLVAKYVQPSTDQSHSLTIESALELAEMYPDAFSILINPSMLLKMSEIIEEDEGKELVFDFEQGDQKGAVELKSCGLRYDGTGIGRAEGPEKIVGPARSPDKKRGMLPDRVLDTEVKKQVPHAWEVPRSPVNQNRSTPTTEIKKGRGVFHDDTMMRAGAQRSLAFESSNAIGDSSVKFVQRDDIEEGEIVAVDVGAKSSEWGEEYGDNQTDAQVEQVEFESDYREPIEDW